MCSVYCFNYGFMVFARGIGIFINCWINNFVPKMWHALSAKVKVCSSTFTFRLVIHIYYTETIPSSDTCIVPYPLGLYHGGNKDLCWDWLTSTQEGAVEVARPWTRQKYQSKINVLYLVSLWSPVLSANKYRRVFKMMDIIKGEHIIYSCRFQCLDCRNSTQLQMKWFVHSTDNRQSECFD